MIIITSGEKVPTSDSAFTKNPHNRNFIEGWHLREEKQGCKHSKN